MRPTPLAWMLVASLIATIVVWPLSEGISLFFGAVFGLLLLALLAEGITGDLPIGTQQDLETWNERKRHALTARFKRGRPEWETTAPDFADEPQDAIFERERKRRGLG